MEEVSIQYDFELMQHFIHSFIHSGHFYNASSSNYILWW